MDRHVCACTGCILTYKPPTFKGQTSLLMRLESGTHYVYKLIGCSSCIECRYAVCVLLHSAGGVHNILTLYMLPFEQYVFCCVNKVRTLHSLSVCPCAIH